MSTITIPVLRDDGKQATIAHRVSADGPVVRTPCEWACPDAASAEKLAAIFAGRFDASPRAARRRVPFVRQDAMSTTGVEATSMPLAPTRRTVPYGQRTAGRKAQQARRRGLVATGTAVLFDTVPYAAQ